MSSGQSLSVMRGWNPRGAFIVLSFLLILQKVYFWKLIISYFILQPERLNDILKAMLYIECGKDIDVSFYTATKLNYSNFPYTAMKQHYLKLLYTTVNHAGVSLYGVPQRSGQSARFTSGGSLFIYYFY